MKSRIHQSFRHVQSSCFRYFTFLAVGLLVVLAWTGWHATAQEANPSPQGVFDIPSSVRQGEALPIVIRQAQGVFDRATVQLAGRSARLFLQKTGDYVALMPVAVEQKPGGYTLTVLDSAGQSRHTSKVEVENAHFPRQNISVSKSVQSLQPLPGEMETIGALKSNVSEARHWSEPFVSPTPDCMNSPFGVLRYHNGKSTGDYHKGVDLRSPAGRPIKAIADGTVKISKMYRLHGGTVGLDHGQGMGSIYIHMSKMAVKEGDTVKQGDVIGYVGSTGFASGPHLHWGLYINGLPVNPHQWVKNVPRC
jgi:murein DD-endopeptidase MepM/ murein hydrolase activator NlpD